MSKVSRLEVILTGARRRWSAEENRRIVAESESGPRQVSATARRHGLFPSQLFNWRLLACEGQLEGMADAMPFARVVIAWVACRFFPTFDQATASVRMTCG
jgi:transposase-like protein